jgi:hypothetical protein
MSGLSNLFKKAPKKPVPAQPSVTFMSSDEWLEEMLDMLDERDRATTVTKSSEGL